MLLLLLKQWFACNREFQALQSKLLRLPRDSHEKGGPLLCFSLGSAGKLPPERPWEDSPGWTLAFLRIPSNDVPFFANVFRFIQVFSQTVATVRNPGFGSGLRS
ncbi:hypothetical protein AVEN_251072-1 [Araneus ventricosus]|uniref:Uncharacterized protein n=1 Tax=Araneus ventricosus TaxID=182803 RepID=A0A4Y2QT92_ARAVE|nr:hypothetical protein AVEN_251072-1 [Araneus ventricosus]